MADENDDLLNPDEIEELLKASGAGGSPPEPEKPQPPANDPDANAGDLLDPSEIEALLQQREGGKPVSAASPDPPPPSDEAERLLQQAEADLAAAVAPELDPHHTASEALKQAKPYEFEQFGRGPATEMGTVGLDALEDVELDLCIELGRTELLIEEVLKLKEGSVVPLDKLAGDPVDILVNGRLVARGEVLVLNDNFCVRVAEILAPDL